VVNLTKKLSEKCKSCGATWLIENEYGNPHQPHKCGKGKIKQWNGSTNPNPIYIPVVNPRDENISFIDQHYINKEKDKEKIIKKKGKGTEIF
tara:strand:+ start:190 stop:465 length:276 start_codon:yes stop_codon:yes gene_type:complete